MRGMPYFRRILELVGLSASVVAALGYISLRSYLNFLGIAATVEFSINQLLYEAYVVALPTLLCVVVIVFAAFSLGLLVWSAAKLVPRPLRRWLFELAASCKPLAQPVPLCLGSIALLSAAAILLFRHVADHTGVLLLPAQDLAKVGQRPLLFLLSVTLLLVAIGAFALLRSKMPEAPSSILGFTVQFSMLTVILSASLISAISFNMNVRRLDLPLVSISNASGKDAKIDCGVLVYSTDEMLAIWNLRNTPSGPRGVIAVRKRTDDDQLLVLGNVDVQGIAKTAVPINSCVSSLAD
jgi:hypothetical protein